MLSVCISIKKAIIVNDIPPKNAETGSPNWCREPSLTTKVLRRLIKKDCHFLCSSLRCLLSRGFVVRTFPHMLHLNFVSNRLSCILPIIPVISFKRLLWPLGLTRCTASLPEIMNTPCQPWIALSVACPVTSDYCEVDKIDWQLWYNWNPPLFWFLLV